MLCRSGTHHLTINLLSPTPYCPSIGVSDSTTYTFECSSLSSRALLCPFFLDPVEDRAGDAGFGPTFFAEEEGRGDRPRDLDRLPCGTITQPKYESVFR